MRRGRSAGWRASKVFYVPLRKRPHLDTEEEAAFRELHALAYIIVFGLLLIPVNAIAVILPLSGHGSMVWLLLIPGSWSFVALAWADWWIRRRFADRASRNR